MHRFDLSQIINKLFQFCSKFSSRKAYQQDDFPSFSSGDTITVFLKLEGDKVRTQSFKGVVIQIKGRGQSKTFTIRKMSGTVELKIFPINMPALKKIQVNKKGKVRQSKFFTSEN